MGNIYLNNKFTIKIAGEIVEIDTISPRTCILCRDYLSEGEPDIRIKITEDDIARERQGTKEPEKKEIFIETIAAYRKIVDSLIPYKVFLMHGAVIAIGNEAYMFTAHSGTGKTTHIKQWLKQGVGAYIVNGDKPLIKIQGQNAYACGTPWCGNEQLNTNKIVPLKSIVLMERNEKNSIKEIPFSEAYTFLLSQTHIPKDSLKAKDTLKLLSQLSGKVKFYRFKFNNFADDCFKTSYTVLTGL